MLAGHCPGGSYAQASTTLSSFVFQFPVLVWWVMVFGFLGGGSLYLVVGGVSMLPCGVGWRHWAPLLVVFFSMVGVLVSRLYTRWVFSTFVNYEAPGVVWVFSLPCHP